jgi:peptide/nickel transport system substrate-binding protein
MRIDPEDKAAQAIVCDLCTEMPKPTDGGKTYTFKIRPGVKFHDGSALTAKDVQASFQRIVFPQQGVSSARKAQFTMVESITAPDDQTVVFKLKHPSGAFIPAVANPFNWIYAKAILDKDQHWFEKNVMGSGPFIFETHEAGAVVKGKRNPNSTSRQALSRRFRGDLREDADAARAGDPR